MRLNCINEQEYAYTRIINFSTKEIEEYELKKILSKAITEWPDDYTMQLYFIEEQIKALKKLKNHT